MATYYTIPITWHYGKGKTPETGKGWAIGRLGLERSVEKVKHEIFLRQWKCSVWDFDGGYMTLYICQNPLNFTA